MIPVVLGGLVGAWLVGRKRPTTKVRKCEAIGSKTGLNYTIEEFPEAGLLMVSRNKICRAVVERLPSGGFAIKRAAGTPEGLEALRKDFGETDNGAIHTKT